MDRHMNPVSRLWYPALKLGGRKETVASRSAGGHEKRSGKHTRRKRRNDLEEGEGGGERGKGRKFSLKLADPGE